MPSVNLRLSDEQHAELIEMAKREDRSLQREIIYRLFGRFNQAPPATVHRPAIVHTAADAESRDVRARTLETPNLPHVDPRGEIKPDFKTQKKK